ncbi:NAD(P)/FAD-dependent oxidoreductase [Nocardiopsis terrae]
MRRTDVLIVGAGHAGVSAATELRRAGFSGTITLVNDEDVVPYHRPPLSKAWLKGEIDADSNWLQPHAFFSTQHIDLLSSTSITELDTSNRLAHTSDGAVVGYTDAIIATGAAARPLTFPGAGEVPLPHLHDVADAARLKSALTQGSRLAIIGGGFIGLEVAATATHFGASVCIIERDTRVLGRLASVGLSRYLTELHRGHGVEVLVDAEVIDVSRTTSGDVEVSLSEGPRRVVDHVLVAIGALPNDELARAAGLECDNGVLVDGSGRTSDAHVYAIGDVARRPLDPFAESARLESVHNANEQGRIVAAAITGQQQPGTATPWFWSDQYDRKLQIAGLLPSAPETELRSDPESGSFALLHRKDGRLVCVEAVNSAREFALGRRQIAADVAALGTVQTRRSTSAASEPMKVGRGQGTGGVR